MGSGEGRGGGEGCGGGFGNGEEGGRGEGGEGEGALKASRGSSKLSIWINILKLSLSAEIQNDTTYSIFYLFWLEGLGFRFRATTTATAAAAAATDPGEPIRARFGPGATQPA